MRICNVLAFLNVTICGSTGKRDRPPSCLLLLRMRAAV